MTTQTQPDSEPARCGLPAAFWLILAFWLIVLAAAGGALYGLAGLYRGDRIAGSITALGRDLGGRTPAQAAAILQETWQARKVRLEAGEQAWTLAPDQLGIVLQADAMAQAAYAQGRALATPQDALLTARRLLATTNLLPMAVPESETPTAWRFDRDAAAATVRTLAGQVEVPTQDAGVQVIAGRVEATPPVTGRALDIAAMLAKLETYPWETLAGDAIPTFSLPIVDRPPAITDVSALIAEVQPLLAGPITLRIYDAIRDERTTLTAAAEDLGRWVTFAISATAAGGQTLTWAVDEEAVAAFVQEQNKALPNNNYVNARTAVPALVEAFKNRQSEVRLQMSHGEREHVVKAGETLSSIAFDYGMPYPWIQAVNPGVGDALFVGDRLRIPSPDVLLPLPVVENKRILVSLKEQRVWVYENGQLKWDWPASTGMAESPTSPGVFQIQTHEELAYAAIWNLYMPWFMGIYRVAPGQEFMNGFHGFPSRDRRQFLWERNLGSPITYGCILVSTTNARLLYDWAEAGVVVEIRP